MPVELNELTPLLARRDPFNFRHLLQPIVQLSTTRVQLLFVGRRDYRNFAEQSFWRQWRLYLQLLLQYGKFTVSAPRGPDARAGDYFHLICDVRLFLPVGVAIFLPN